MAAQPTPAPRVVHCKRAAPGTFVYIGRPSKFGNPFPLDNPNDAAARDRVIRQYELHLRNQPQLMRDARAELRGRNLGCYCAPRPCHGDVLLRIANSDK
jgi:hypothetical protein